MRGSLGATRRERVLSENASRQVVLVNDPQRGMRIVRRICASPDGPDLVDRAIALGLLRQVRVPGFAYVEDRALVGATLEIAESFVEGFTLASALEAVREHITVSVAIAVVYDIARGLELIHSIVEPSGRPASLIHGRLEMEQVMLTPEGDVRVIGIEGLRGDARRDVQDLLRLLHSLLVSKASSRAGSALLSRLAKLEFESAEQMTAALSAYLRKQSEEEVGAKRAAFAREVAKQAAANGAVSGMSGSNELPNEAVQRIVIPETPTDASRNEDTADAYDASGIPGAGAGSAAGAGSGAAAKHESYPFPKRKPGATLGFSDAIQMDDDGDGPTVTDGIPAMSDPEPSLDTADAILSPAPTQVSAPPPAPAPASAPHSPALHSPAPHSPAQHSPAIAIDREARLGLLAPAAAQPKAELKWPGAERSVSIGNYRVVASIGRGGMGEIYLARAMSEHYRGLVALKVLGPEDSGDDEALGMFIDEASIMARIDHPNVLKVVDFGRAKGRHFLAMEYLEGRPLVRVMIDAYQRETGLDYGVIAAIGADAARGLFAAHTATTPEGSPLKVVHRDVSPQNIFVTYQGTTKVIDFGVARATQRVSKTAVGVVKGKAAYMSPEQTEGKEVDARSDVFSLGVCLWEMTAGRRLFKRESEYETLMAVSTAPIERPTNVRGKPNPVLDRVILNALTRNREKRTQSALELAAQLTEYAQGVGLKEPHTSVSELMQRLFGSVAAEEQALIRSLEERVATEDEADSLRRLSGVSPRKGMKQEVTLVGAPSGLLELDHFGEDESSGATIPPPDVDSSPSLTPSGSAPYAPTSASPAPPSVKPKSSPLMAKISAQKPPSTGDIVLRAVAAIKAEQAATAPMTQAYAPGEEPMPTPATPLTIEPDPSSSLLSPLSSSSPAFTVSSGESSVQIEIDDSGFEVIGSLSGASPVVTAPPRETSVATLQVSHDFESAESSTTAKRPARAGGMFRAGAPARRALVYVISALLIGAFTVVAFVARTHKSTESAPASREAPLQNKSVGSPAPGTIAAREPAHEKEPVRAPAVVLEPVTTSSATVRELIEDIGGRGLNITASEGTFLVTDKSKGSVVIDKNATAVSVESVRAKGWIAETTKRGLTELVWIGTVGDGPWFTRALSVNDCPAQVRVSAAGLAVTYGWHRVELPHGGGALEDVSLDRPAFAKRLELEPLHLAFGRKSDASDATFCTIGWWGKQVVLRSLPAGRYTLVWIGDDAREEAVLDVGPKEVVGGRLVRTSSGAR